MPGQEGAEKVAENTMQHIAALISQGREVPGQEPPTIVEVSSSRRTHAFDVAAALGDCRLARLDEREDVLDAAMLEAEDRGIPLLTFPCPATALALKDASVDAVVTFDTWSALPQSDIDRRFVEISRCLRRGGMVFVLALKTPPPDLLEQSLNAAGFEVLPMSSSDDLISLPAIKR